jgi:type I restriction enzyme R subunit
LSAIRNAKSVKGTQPERSDQELISRSIESDDIVDVFAMAGLERADISILNEEFLLGAKKRKDSIDIKIELMKTS